MVSPLRLFALLAPLVACGPALATPVAAAHDRPAAVTQAATDVAPDGTTLNGTVTPNGRDTHYVFVYGTSRYDAHTAVADAGDGSAPVAVSAHIDGLAASTTYHFALVAFSGYHRFANGGDQTFTTTAAPLPAPPQPAAQPQPQPQPAPAPSTTFSLTPAGPPVLGQSVNVDVRSGEVKVKLPGTTTYVAVTDLSSIPVGSLLDTREGSITLRSALPGGRTQSGIFHGGLFEIRQLASGTTELKLRGAPPACPRARASAAATTKKKKKKKPPRRLWGHDDHGNFRTRGGNSVATVRGTIWFVEDRCDGTLTRVSKGTVSVYDSHRHVSVVVHAGHSYLAKR
jgi:hypothetical protein